MPRTELVGSVAAIVLLASAISAVSICSLFADRSIAARRATLANIFGK
jgi:hypothetical protein